MARARFPLRRVHDSKSKSFSIFNFQANILVKAEQQKALDADALFKTQGSKFLKSCV
jgi:hypothetical protein